MRRQVLFSELSMFDVIEHQKQEAAKRVQQIGSAQLQLRTEQELVEQIVKEYRLEVPVMQDTKIYVAESGESQVDVSRDPLRFIRDGRQPFYVQGTRTVIAIPFEGDADLFKVRPTSFGTTRPSGEIVGREVRLTYEQAEPNTEAIKTAYTKTLQEIKKYLDWQRPSADDLNSQLEELVRQGVSERKKKIAAAAGMIDSLGLPTVRPE